VSIICTFIIPHKGREELLVKTVKSIIAQHIDDFNIEILIITQNNSLNELDCLLIESSNIHIFPLPQNKTISELRNFGALNAKGKYLAFLDADIEIAPNWLTEMIHLMNIKKSYIMLSSIQVNSINSGCVEQVRTSLNNLSQDSTVDSLNGSNLFLLKEIFQQTKGFPEKMKTCEDIFFSTELSKKGELFITSTTTHVHLGEDQSYSQLFTKEIWRGQSNLQSTRGRKVPLRELPSIVIPIAMIFLFISAFLFIISEAPLATFVSFILLISPITIYSVRLSKLSNNKVKFWHVFKFYLVYFPARAIGTLGGLFKSFSNSNNK